MIIISILRRSRSFLRELIFRSSDVPIGKQAEALPGPSRYSLSGLILSVRAATLAEGGIIDIVDEGKTGFLLPRNDIESLAERVRILRQNPDLRLQMGIQGRQRIESHFNIDTISTTMLDLLKSAAAGRA